MDHNFINETLSEDELFYFVEYSPEQAERVGYSDYSYWKSVFQSFFKKKVAVTLTIVFFGLIIFSFFALAISKYSFDTIKPNSKLAFTRPNAEYWFGTDNLGRDYWCQVWYACQTSIKLSIIVALGEFVIGVIMGCIWGYVRKLGRILQFVYDLLNNVPTIIYMTLIALLIGKSFAILAISLIAFNWIYMARNIRNLVMIYRDREYNLASRCLGTSTFNMIRHNIIPYLISVIILRLALSIPSTIAYESTLSYLGLGLGVDTPSLGILLRNARSFFIDFPYLLIFPAVIVSIITITFYLIGNAFSDAADPRNHV